MGTLLAVAITAIVVLATKANTGENVVAIFGALTTAVGTITGAVVGARVGAAAGQHVAEVAQDDARRAELIKDEAIAALDTDEARDAMARGRKAAAS